ncbi:unnamed protein product [Lactuca saligna]|uniref:Uncharacterized protein n=1 Tax=Lactuca saligna TaxID=75948 RepID=A0AA35Z245_LACSI|nr:unnamed protein product [Lactuca saligna]CAI9284301.1 unnamed protein product [Lactuca saligna]
MWHQGAIPNRTIPYSLSNLLVRSRTRVLKKQTRVLPIRRRSFIATALPISCRSRSLHHRHRCLFYTEILRHNPAKTLESEPPDPKSNYSNLLHPIPAIH